MGARFVIACTKQRRTASKSYVRNAAIVGQTTPAPAAQPVTTPAPATKSPAPPQLTAQASSSQPANSSAQPTAKTVTIPDPTRIRVPSLVGLPIRKVIEQAAASGLEVQIVGNGTCRQQAPDPGAMVPSGTRIIVRCGH